MKKKILATAMTMAMVLGAFFISPKVDVMASESVPLEIEDVEVTTEQLVDGVTVVLTRNEDDTFDQAVYYDTDAAAIPMPTAGADGVLEIAAFHLGFNDWNDDTGRLYYTISADEPMSSITGNAYVKSTSILFPKSYYSDSFTGSLHGSLNTSRTLKDNVNTGDETKVRVGFSGVVLTTTAGEKGYFSDTSQVVDR